MTLDEVKEFPLEWYKPSESQEHYDEATNSWYNRFGQRLRDPREYEPDEDGCYEPFGDE